MLTNGVLLLISFIVILLILAKPLGTLLARFIEGSSLGALGHIEATLWKISGISQEEMNWRHYLWAIILFNIVGFVFLMAILMMQNYLPFNPQNFDAMPLDLAFNTAISFVTNTNWQSYAGESTLSYFSQMVGLTVQNFLSAATGIAVAFALIRAFSRHSMETLGNAWSDLFRITLWVLLPLAVIVTVIFMQQGVIQNLSEYQIIQTLEGQQQLLPMGPVASQEAIKLLGTNGGGFFNVNSSHPFENPTALTNFIQMISILLIPTALCFAFGEVVSDKRQGITLLATMILIFTICAAIVMWSETHGNLHFVELGADNTMNMEGKESRFGVLTSSLFAVVTTAASCGAVNAMHDSFTPIGGMLPMLLMQIGEVVFGGVGSGLYGILLFMLLAVFIAGLMIGRTPEYLGKKIEVREMKLTAFAILVTPSLVLLGSTLALMTEAGRAAIFNPGAHGFSEVLYALSSTANNNGSAFAGLSANTPFWNILLAFCMLIGRFTVIAFVLAIAGSLVTKKAQTAGIGTLSTTGPLFVGLLTATILLIGALTFIPSLALGPVAEQLAFTHLAEIK